MESHQLRPRNGLKFLLSLGLILGSTAYALWQSSVSAGGLAVAPGAAPNTTPATPTPPASVTVTPAPAPTVVQNPPAQTPTPTPAASPKATQGVSPEQPAPTTASGYADGSYTGSVANAYYGLVQVQAVVSGGKLTDVKFLQYPNDRSTSRYISGQAMPLLRSEAIQAQSAHVNGVSGATDTSAAFVQSLGSALAQAHV